MKGKMLFSVIAAVLIFVPAAIGERSDEVKSIDSDEVSQYKVLDKAGIPHSISYQGFLADADGNPVTDTVSMTFSIWDAATGGSQLWSEMQSSVAVANGLFSVLLGSANPIPSSVFSAASLWLQTQVGTELLSPRKEIVSVGHAFRAEVADTAGYSHNADMVDGRHASDFAGDGHSLDAADGNPMDAVYVDSAGKVGIGTTNPQAALHVSGGDKKGIVIVGGAGKVGIGTTDPRGALHVAGAGERGIVIVDNKVGIGTTSPQKKLHIAEETIGNWYDADQLVISTTEFMKYNECGLILGYGYEDGGSGSKIQSIDYSGTGGFLLLNPLGGNIGIGTRAPSEKLEISGGDLKISDHNPEHFFVDVTAGDDDWYISVNANEMQFCQFVEDAVAAERVRIDGQGNVGIGIAIPWGKLHVHTPDPGMGSILGITSEETNVLNALLFGEGYYDQGLSYDATWSGIGAVEGDLRFIAGGDYTTEYLDELISSPHMRITSSGNIGIGTMSPSEKLDVNGTARLRNMSTGTGTDVVVDRDGVLMTKSSSKRYKRNIRNLEIEPDVILKLQPVRFEWKTTDEEDLGLIAEDVEQVIPDLVIYDAEGRPDAVKYDEVAIYLLETIKAQQKKISNLEKKIEELEKGYSLMSGN